MFYIKYANINLIKNFNKYYKSIYIDYEIAVYTN